MQLEINKRGIWNKFVNRCVVTLKSIATTPLKKQNKEVPISQLFWYNIIAFSAIVWLSSGVLVLVTGPGRITVPPITNLYS